MGSKEVALAILVILAYFVTKYEAEARYLPTRSNGDRIDKLRELLKDLLESELEKEDTETQRWRPESKYFVKREVGIEATPTLKKSISRH